jgi:LysM domain
MNTIIDHDTAECPPSPCTIGRRLASTGSTLVVASVLIGAALLAGRRIGQLRTMPVPNPIDPVVVVVVLVALATLFRLARPESAFRRIGLVPLPLQLIAQRTMELSHFGAGPLTGWTTHHPDASLSRIEPAPTVESIRDDEAPVDRAIEPGEAAPIRSGDRRRNGARVADAPGEQKPAAPAGEVIAHTVQRGETFWSLAESMLGDPKEWSTIRHLNVGRQVAPDTVMADDDVLRSGWSIVLPRLEGSRSHVGS